MTAEKATVSTLKLMANAYVDLGHFNGLTPYVGAGIGGAYVTYKDYMQDAGEHVHATAPPRRRCTVNSMATGALPTLSTQVSPMT